MLVTPQQQAVLVLKLPHQHILLQNKTITLSKRDASTGPSIRLMLRNAKTLILSASIKILNLQYKNNHFIFLIKYK
jgi:hypothetical protein